MPLRDEICAQRAAVGRIDQDLAEIEQRLASRAARNVIDHARKLARASAELLDQALRQPLEEAAPEPGDVVEVRAA